MSGDHIANPQNKNTIKTIKENKWNPEKKKQIQLRRKENKLRRNSHNKR